MFSVEDVVKGKREKGVKSKQRRRRTTSKRLPRYLCSRLPSHLFPLFPSRTFLGRQQHVPRLFILLPSILVRFERSCQCGTAASCYQGESSRLPLPSLSCLLSSRPNPFFPSLLQVLLTQHNLLYPSGSSNSEQDLIVASECPSGQLRSKEGGGGGGGEGARARLVQPRSWMSSFRSEIRVERRAHTCTREALPEAHEGRELCELNPSASFSPRARTKPPSFHPLLLLPLKLLSSLPLCRPTTPQTSLLSLVPNLRQSFKD